MQLLKLAIEVALILLRWWFDPERAVAAASERLEKERARRREKFREALAKKDEDTVAGMLSGARGRLRGKDGVSDGK